MDIAGLSTELASISLMTEVGTQMLSKAMDTGEALGAGLVEMMDAAAMERSAHPELGANSDMRI